MMTEHQERSGQPLTLLVVDDEPMLRAFVPRIFRKNFDVVQTASNPEEALAMLEASGGRVDVIISDVNMPQMDGFQFYEELVDRFPQLAARTVFVTGNPSNLSWFQTRGIPVVSKPFRPEDLRKAVLQRVWVDQ